jgi:hypothetical protein
MTERLGEPTGHRARWTAAVLLAPGAAALFGATMTWAATTKPTTAVTGQAVSVVAPAPVTARRSGTGLSAQARALRADALARHRERAQLTRQLTVLHRDLASIRAAERQERAAAAAARAAAAAMAAQSSQPGQSYQPAQTSQPAQAYQAPAQTYQAPAQTYQAPVQNLPPVPAPAPVAAPPPPPPVQGTTGGSGKP